MTAQVRCYSYKGIVSAFVASYSEQLSYPSVTIFAQPYLAREVVSASTAAAQATTTDLSPDHSKLLRVEVEPGKRVHYEVTPAGQTLREADTSSPVIEGNDVLHWGSGWRISFLEAS